MDCYILAGGESKRFGENKLLYRIGGKRVLEIVTEKALEVCSFVFLVVKERDPYESIGIPIVEDVSEDRCPAVGVYTALSHSQEERVLILSGDLPLIKREVLELLMNHHRDPITICEAKGRLHPLIGIYSRSVRESLGDYLRRGKKSMMGFLKEVGFKVLEEDTIREADPDLDSFTNMNTKEDLKKVEGKMEWISKRY